MRCYEGGQIVGKPDPPGDFDEWLRSEIEHVKKITEINERLNLFDPYAQARLRALKEVTMVWKVAELKGC